MLKAWAERKVGLFPTLRSIAIVPGEDPVGLRGIERTAVSFDFPVSVLVGANGCGKSTLLSLAALAYNGAGFVPSGRSKAGYTFVEFFARTKVEADPLNISITWDYSEGDPQTIHRKSTKKWMHYDRRVARPVQYIGLSRIADPSVSAGHRRTFVAGQKWTATEISKSVREHLAKILQRDYASGQTLTAPKYSLPILTTQNPYSGFNMGTGEAALLSILLTLDESPRGSLVLIEEVELGLHPGAQAKLAEAIVDIAKKNQLQVICTSHSEWFIDALPREARVLVTRGATDHTCMTGVTTRSAITSLSGQHTPELRVVCEDELASRMLSAALPLDLRQKVQLVAIGAKTILLPAARSLLIENPSVPVLVVWDGDVTDKVIRDSFASSNLLEGGIHRGAEWCRLPGAVDEQNTPILNDKGLAFPPEEAIRKTLLRRSAVLEAMAASMGASPDQLMSALQRAALGEGAHHGLFRHLANELVLSEETVADIVLRGYCSVVDWSEIELVLRRMLRGDIEPFHPPVPDAGQVAAGGEARTS